MTTNPIGCPWHLSTALGAGAGLCVLLASAMFRSPPPELVGLLAIASALACTLAAWVGWVLGSVGAPAQVEAVRRTRQDEHGQLLARILALETTAQSALQHPQAIEVHVTMHDAVKAPPRSQGGGRI